MFGIAQPVQIAHCVMGVMFSFKYCNKISYNPDGRDVILFRKVVSARNTKEGIN